MNAADNMTSGESENNIPVIFENSKSDEFGTSISHGDYDWQPKYVRWNAVKTDILDVHTIEDVNYLNNLS